MITYAPDSLRANLTYEPQPLKFGTSGRRGEVIHLTQLEIYINVTAELEYLQSLPVDQGGIRRGDEFYYARDLRPSSDQLVTGRGELAQAVQQAIRDAGMQAVNLGRLPTPALTSYAIERGKGSIMVTGSHIPFERNGYKTNTARGELLKKDEASINALVEQVRERIYAQTLASSLFSTDGMLKTGSARLADECTQARTAYIARYTSFFAGADLSGLRLLAYQHSAVGRDLLVEILRALGAEVIPAGRSETFVPIDTENIDATQLATIQSLLDEAIQAHGGIDAVVSTDGDSDRPLILGVDAGGKARFFGGDLVGMVVAQYLAADAVVVPISCNDAIDRGVLADKLEPKTRIGSPFVIAGMEAARAKGRTAVCGWEANGGFLTGCDIVRNGRALKALPTRDAMLPILATLFAAKEAGLALTEVFERLPKRYSRAALLKQFPRPVSTQIVRMLTPDAWNRAQLYPDDAPFCPIRERIERFFEPQQGFAAVEHIDYTDGVRIYFTSGDVAHVRPSGNADELRIYAVADNQQRADEIAAQGVREPNGILRNLASEAAPQAAALALSERPQPFALCGVVQHYEWGGFDYIPNLLGEDNPDSKPYAELWIGAHTSAPSIATVEGIEVGLDKLQKAAPDVLLGQKQPLPYLLKVLHAHKMLSIQAHPTKTQAEQGYERENAAGISLKAPNRNYKDDNHKPEVHVALTEFWMLHGFRPLEDIAVALRETEQLRAIMPDFTGRLVSAGEDPAARKQLLRDLYGKVMTMDQAQVDAILNPLIDRLTASRPTNKDSADYWALRAAENFPLPGGHRDRGILSCYLLNLVHLHPGEGTYQPAGALHAYLEGVNVELMANSDNVLRGGLTPKHVDAQELLNTLTFDSGNAEVLSGEQVSDSERVYRTPADEFELSRLAVAPSRSFLGKAANGPDAIVVLSGCVVVKSGQHSLTVEQGGIAMAPCGLDYVIDAITDQAELFKASVP